MKINRENYEPYFIDLLDGTLSNEMVDELLDFLRLNPDLADELKGLEDINLDPDEQVSFDHSKLIRTGFDQPEVFDETCIRSIEGDLSNKEEQAFKSYLQQNEKAEAEYDLFKATILEPDLLVVYPNKGSLKHTVKIRPYWYAAAAVLLLGVVFWFNVPQADIVAPVAQVVPVIDEQPSATIKVKNLKDNFASIQLAEEKRAIKKEEAIPQVKSRNTEVLQPMLAELSVPVVENNMENSFALATVPVKKPINLEAPYPTVPELLAAEVNKIDVKSEAQKIGHFALDKLRDITDDKLSYATNANGNVRKIEYNSRLLAFSVPMKKGN